jgi:molybdate transport system ATP-binding protein
MLSAKVTARRGAFTLDAEFATPTPGVTALFGRSGCGKTTLVNVLAGLQPARGRIALDDAVWLDSGRGIDVPAEKRRIGYVFQDARLFPHYTPARGAGPRVAVPATPAAAG